MPSYNCTSCSTGNRGENNLCGIWLIWEVKTESGDDRREDNGNVGKYKKY